MEADQMKLIEHVQEGLKHFAGRDTARSAGTVECQILLCVRVLFVEWCKERNLSSDGWVFEFRMNLKRLELFGEYDGEIFPIGEIEDNLRGNDAPKSSSSD